jgi:hypothetical protein
VPAGPSIVGNQGEAVGWELIYSGRSGNEVSLSYREYMAAGAAAGIARPAFYQDLKYDLAHSHRIVFRSMELEIVDASNAGVQFRVLRDGEPTGFDQGDATLSPHGP